MLTGGGLHVGQTLSSGQHGGPFLLRKKEGPVKQLMPVWVMMGSRCQLHQPLATQAPLGGQLHRATTRAPLHRHTAQVGLCTLVVPRLGLCCLSAWPPVSTACIQEDQPPSLRQQPEKPPKAKSQACIPSTGSAL